MNELETYRVAIDAIDEKILQLLAKRNSVAIKVGDYKKRQQLPIVDLKRCKAVLRQRVQSGKEKELNPKYVKNLWTTIHTESVRIQKQLWKTQKISGGNPHI